ncbi:SDR family NAD(P)-dependent oxidoreductase [Streptomyces sp. NBC_01092]|uniref:SDR family NAD(P)-dependent oxidoreductase n=1 Tax=Streptomyces sp. NBC_01092 TaxID=2903748 RepID=UPI003869743D|nr:SDR family oxidoreductase [Streptomyces sp. NBC_01092]
MSSRTSRTSRVAEHGEERRVAVVSGGSRGLGLGLIAHLLDEGYHVATFSRTESEGLTKLRASLADPDRLHWSQLDGAGDQAGAAADFVRDIVRRRGRVDLLVNNAGIGLEGLLSTTPPTALDRALQVNLNLPVHLTRACLKPMLARGGGCVVNISSINAVRGQQGVAVYSAAKAGLDGLTRSLAKEVGPAGIRVVGLAPGYFDSEMTAGMPEDTRRRLTRRTPLGRLGTVDDVVDVFAFLISDRARFITGQTITVDGGYTC